MIELLFYTELSCADTAEMLERIAVHDWLNNEAKVELVEVLQEATPHCPWDAND
jgi:ferredoxin|tara:strand:+ start:229 stop:390 length:162 start_codon:yes stop_codon:yes gene_type:complete